jgi:hypothetical protein
VTRTFLQGLSEVASREIAGEASYCHDFLADMVETNDLGSLSFVEVAADGIPNLFMKLRLGVSFSENRGAEGSCESAFRRVLDD